MMKFLQSRLMQRVAIAGVAVFFMGMMPAAQAESFKEALVSAYRSNPTLQAERARQRGTDELVPTAKSGWRPQITAGGQYKQNYASGKGVPGTVDWDSPSVNIELTQPLFRGFKTVEGVAEAKESVKAGRQQLLAVEQQVLLDAATAYMNVIRDRRILALREQNVTNLQRQANAARARFEAGEVTRTDVSQAQARVSGAKAQVASARATLAESSARYAQIIGHKPDKLASPGFAKNPKSLSAAVDIASTVNPNILAAMHVQLAQEHNIEVVKGDLLPSASLVASASTSHDARSETDGQQTSYSVAGVVSVPIYEGGSVYSAVRRAKQLESQRRIEIVEAARSVVKGVTTAWSFLAAAREGIASAKAQVSAAADALNGVRQEYLVGSRSTIDVLNAEQEVINARINLVSAEHDQLLASYELQAAIGKLTARNLGLAGPYYDAKENYRLVKNKWIGTDAQTVE
ncbi:MAG: TolC family outer membrane protein [Rhizobiales bacterium]|nr:TolC family outer membrane protein [Hyphomicrobiales bacterium]